MSRVDIALDLETLSIKNNATILQIAAVAFDIKTGKTIREFKLELDWTTQQKTGSAIDAPTFKFWLNQDNKLIEEVFSGQIDIKLALENLTKWIRTVAPSYKDTYLWGNGIIADNTWIKNAYEVNDLVIPIFYRNHRDVRTLLEMTANHLNQTESTIMSKVKNEGVAHNALDDARWCAKLITTCYNILV
jgi:hypothetical protein